MGDYDKLHDQMEDAERRIGWVAVDILNVPNIKNPDAALIDDALVAIDDHDEWKNGEFNDFVATFVEAAELLDKAIHLSAQLELISEFRSAVNELMICTDKLENDVEACSADFWNNQ